MASSANHNVAAVTPDPQPVPPTAVVPEGPAAANLVEAHGITFLPGADYVERLLTELRRRGKWVQSLRGQEVSSASAPAVLLVGDVSCGQRRLTRMIARALAEGGVSSGDVHTLDADDLAEIMELIEDHPVRLDRLLGRTFVAVDIAIVGR